MLSSVLRSRRSIEVNIHIMRTFVVLKNTLTLHKELSEKLGALEKHLHKHDEEILLIFEAIKRLMALPAEPKRKIGF